MPNNLALFLALVSGFCFLRILNLTRYASQTWEGTRLLFWTGAASAVLLFVSRMVMLGLDSTGVRDLLRSFKSSIAPWDFAGTIGLAVLLGIVLPLLINLLLPADLSGWLASRTVGSGLHHLLYDLVGTGKAICVTLSDRKVYVGLVLRTPRLHPGERFFELLPLRSGYREKDTGELRLVVDYSPLFRALVEGDLALENRDLEDFLVLLPFDEVLSARVFDAEIFASPLFIIKEVKAADSTPTPPSAG